MKTLSKINSIHFAGTWIALSILIGVICPLLVWIFIGKYMWFLSIIGGISLHEQSHGESFLSIVENRFGGKGIYILDAPERVLGELF